MPVSLPGAQRPDENRPPSLEKPPEDAGHFRVLHRVRASLKRLGRTRIATMRPHTCMKATLVSRIPDGTALQLLADGSARGLRLSVEQGLWLGRPERGAAGWSISDGMIAGRTRIDEALRTLHFAGFEPPSISWTTPMRHSTLDYSTPCEQTQLTAAA